MPTNPSLTDAVDRASLGVFDSIIDVRSPSEFAEDHIPGAINLPVLNDEERALVGATYVQTSRFLARRIGAALVARNVAHHLETALVDAGPKFRPLIYCWRGGQRSNAMAIILAQIGWRVSVLQGGYKTYRRSVQARLYEHELGLRLVLLAGGTGSGKTAILERAKARGVQTVDFEALARHRGSLFGARDGVDQPSQKLFETRLWAAFGELDPLRPVLVEAESNKIGDRTLPPSVWTAMRAAPRIDLVAPLEVRAEYLLRAYPEIAVDRAKLEYVFSRLSVYPGRKRLEAWRDMADGGDFPGLAREVVERHYDPAYARSSRRDRRTRLAEIRLERLDDASLDAAADEVARTLARLG